MASFFCKDMGIMFWGITIIILCIITGVIFYKPYLGIAAVVIFIPFEGLVNLNCISNYPIEAILAVLTLVCVLKRIMGTEQYFGNRKLVFYYFPFMLCILLSSFKFMELSLTLKEIVRWLELIAIYYLTINLINDHKKMTVILYSMVLTAVVVSIWGIINYLGGAVTIDGRHGASSFFGHPNALSGYVNLIIPVLFGMLMVCALLRKKIVLGCSIALMIATWFLTFSKSGWLSLIMTLLLVSFLAKERKRIAFLLIILTVSFAIVFLSSNIRDDFVNRLKATYKTIEYRTTSYPIGFNMIRDNLFFGIGAGNYPLLIEKYADITAESRYTRSLKAREGLLGSDHIDVAYTLNNLAGLYSVQGRYSDAESQYRRSLKIREKELGPDHLDVAATLYNLAELYRVQGRYSEAETHYKRSLKIRESALGQNSYDVATTLHNLALIFYSQGKYVEAEILYKRSLKMDEISLGTFHPRVATSLNNLAGFYYSQGKYAKAEPLYMRALEIDENVLDHYYPNSTGEPNNIAGDLNNLALLYYSQGKFTKAEAFYKRAIEIDNNVIDQYHANVAGGLNKLVVLFRAKGVRTKEAGTFIKTNLHNLYLQIFVEAGILGLCTFVFWSACMLKYLTSTLKSLGNSRDYGIFVGLVGGVIVYLFGNFTDVLVVHGIHLQWGIILGLAVALTQFRETKTCLKAI